MDIKYELSKSYRKEMLMRYFNTSDENEIIEKIREQSVFRRNYMLSIYNAINNFAQFTNVSFPFSKDITLKNVQELRNELVESIDNSLIILITNYCENNKIEYSRAEDLLIINGEIYSQGNHVFYNVFELGEKLKALTKGNSK